MAGIVGIVRVLIRQLIPFTGIARYRKVISLLSDVACLHSIGACVACEEYTKVWNIIMLWKRGLFKETHFDQLIFKVSV